MSYLHNDQYVSRNGNYQRAETTNDHNHLVVIEQSQRRPRPLAGCCAHGGDGLPFIAVGQLRAPERFAAFLESIDAADPDIPGSLRVCCC